MFNEILKEIEAAELSGVKNFKVPVKEKTNTIKLFSFLVKSGYNPSFEEADGNAYIQIQLKDKSGSFQSKIIDLKTRVKKSVVSVQKNVIQVNFNRKIEDNIKNTEEASVIPLRNTVGTK